MTNKTLVVPVVLVAASVCVVLGVYLVVAPGRGSPSTRGDAPMSAERSGIAAADRDSARRFERDDVGVPDDAPPTFEPSAVAGVPQEVLDERMRPPPPPEPAEPVVLDEEAQAAQDAFFALRDQVAKEVRQQLDQQVSELKSACWKPALVGEATSANFSINANFDAQGKLLGLGIADGREGGGAPAVGQCLRQQALQLKVPPPGQSITVDVPLRLP